MYQGVWKLVLGVLVKAKKKHDIKDDIKDLGFWKVYEDDKKW